MNNPTIGEQVAAFLEDMVPSNRPPTAAKTAHVADPIAKIGGLSKDALVEMSQQLWNIVKDVVDSDDALFNALRYNLDEIIKSAEDAVDDVKARESIDEILSRNPGPKAPLEVRTAYASELIAAKAKTAAKVRGMDAVREALYFALLVTHADGQLTAIGLSRWADNGFPQITMGHKYCAALLCTGVSEDALDHVQPPWSAFFIEVPTGMLKVDSKLVGRAVEVKRILVLRLPDHKRGPAWAYIALTDSTVSLWRFGVMTAELLPPVIEGSELFQQILHHDTTNEALTDEDEHVTMLIGRLIINTCLAMSNQTNVKPVGPGHKAYAASRNKRGEREPVVRTFQVGKPIALDLRDTVASFIKHGPRGPQTINVQVLVRGHFKTQRHGPKNSLVKVIWLEPYWRGPEDAPILTRPHDLKRDE